MQQKSSKKIKTRQIPNPQSASLFRNVSLFWWNLGPEKLYLLESNSQPSILRYEDYGNWGSRLSVPCCVSAAIKNSLLIFFANKTLFRLVFEDLQLSVSLFLVLSNWCSLHLLIISLKHSLSQRSKDKSSWFKDKKNSVLVPTHVSFHCFLFSQDFAKHSQWLIQSEDWVMAVHEHILNKHGICRINWIVNRKGNKCNKHWAYSIL